MSSQTFTFPIPVFYGCMLGTSMSFQPIFHDNFSPPQVFNFTVSRLWSSVTECAEGHDVGMQEVMESLLGGLAGSGPQMASSPMRVVGRDLIGVTCGTVGFLVVRFTVEVLGQVAQTLNRQVVPRGRTCSTRSFTLRPCFEARVPMFFLEPSPETSTFPIGACSSMTSALVKGNPTLPSGLADTISHTM